MVKIYLNLHKSQFKQIDTICKRKTNKENENCEKEKKHINPFSYLICFSFSEFLVPHFFNAFHINLFHVPIPTLVRNFPSKKNKKTLFMYNYLSKLSRSNSIQSFHFQPLLFLFFNCEFLSLIFYPIC